MHRFPNGAQAKGFWHKELPDHAPDWLPRWDNPEADPGETRTYLVVDEPAALVWAANFGALEWHAWTSRIDAAAPADVRADRPRPRRRDDAGTTCWCSPGCTAPRSSTSASGRAAEGHRPARHPDLGADRAAARASTTPGLGRAAVADGRRASSRSWSAGSGRCSERARPGPARLHAERDQQDARRAVQPAAGTRARRCRRRSTGTSSTTRTCGRTGSRSARSRGASRRGAICSPRLLTSAQHLPPL